MDPLDNRSIFDQEMGSCSNHLRVVLYLEREYRQRDLLQPMGNKRSTNNH